MKTLLYSLLCLCFLYSCSGAADDVIPGDPSTGGSGGTGSITGESSIKLGLKQNGRNIFEPSVFNIRFEFEGKTSYTGADISEAYDSIIWVVSGHQGLLPVFIGYNSLHQGTSLTWLWSHRFYSPGHYEACLHGYKNNKIVCSDTLQVDVTDNKDFLGWNWNELTDLNRNIGHINALNRHYEFTTKAAISQQGIPSIELYLSNSLGEEEKLFSQKSNTVLYNYITSLYHQPAYDRNSSELADKYNTLFSKKEENVQPCAIWLTCNAKIVLLKKDVKNSEMCWIYAEPE